MADVRSLTLALGGRWHGHYGVAPCPICQPERRSDQSALTLAISTNGRLLLHCKKVGCSFRDLLQALGSRTESVLRQDACQVARARADVQGAALRRSRQAKAMWLQARPIEGTPAETYLRGRGLTCNLPETLRFHPKAWHGPSAEGLPAMLSFVGGSEVFAIHRTWIRSDGSGKANLDPDRAMLGSVKGGAVRLLDDRGPLVVAEGIETALSLGCGLLDGPIRLWAALSASGMRALRLPLDPGSLIIATDGDAPGRSAGFDLAARADALGWQVSFCHAPDGCDWNDILMRKGA